MWIDWDRILYAGDPRRRIPCRRVTLPRTIEQHLACPYCSKCAEDVESGEHARFCGFDPARDPIVFGFPAEWGRHVET